MKDKLSNRIINENDIVIQEAAKMRNDMAETEEDDMHQVEDDMMIKKVVKADDDLGSKNLAKTKVKTVVQDQNN